MTAKPSNQDIILVLSGGVGLGAYQAGACEAMLGTRGVWPSWFAASSVGAVNAALIAGSAARDPLESLRRFWTGSDQGPKAEFAPPPTLPHERWVWNWMVALGARLAGAPGFFYPRLSTHSDGRFTSLYDLAPTRAKLEKLVDFGRLNNGEVRITVATTDIESGECVLFDTARGDRITCDHLLASCGFLPEFAPVQIDGRLLGDGGFSANAPLEPVFAEKADGRPVFVLDLFAAEGGRPADLTEALARRNDLLFANQTLGRLAALQRLSPRHVLHLSYRAPRHEAGPERPFDFSRDSLHERWHAGRLDMIEALKLLRHERQSMGTVRVRRS
jgi:NTE family protein